MSDQGSHEQLPSVTEVLRSSPSGKRVALSRPSSRGLRIVCLVLAVLVAVMSGLLIAYHQRQQPRLTTQVTGEDFLDSSWRSRWHTAFGGFAVRDGALVATGPEANFLILNQQVDGDLTIEFDGWFNSSVPPGDLSVVWASRIDQAKPDDSFLSGDYWLMQTGGYSNSASMISRQEVGRLDSVDRVLEADRRYHIKVEIEGSEFRLLIDGKLECQVREPFPPTRGWIGLYAYYPGKHFDNVVVTVKDLPPTVPSTAIGDAFAAAGQLDQALASYRRVIASDRDGQQVDEARYKAGLCLLQQGDESTATWIWSGIRGPRQLDVLPFRIRRWVDEGRHHEALAAIERLAGNAADGQRLAISTWVKEVGNHGKNWTDADLARWLELQVRILPVNEAIAQAAFAALQPRGRQAEVLTRYPNAVYACSQALYDLGRYDEMVERYPQMRMNAARAMLAHARYDEVVRRYPEIGWISAISLRRLDRLESIIDSTVYGPSLRAKALGERGRLEELLASFPTYQADQQMARWWLGQTAEVLAGTPCEAGFFAALATNNDEAIARHGAAIGSASVAWVAAAQAVSALEEGSASTAALFAGLIDQPLDDDGPAICYATAIAAMAKHWSGDTDGARRSLIEVRTKHPWSWGRQVWYLAGRALGELKDDEFDRSPMIAGRTRMLALGRAFQADLDGRAEAVELYRAVTVLPSADLWPDYDPLLKRLATARLHALGARRP